MGHSIDYQPDNNIVYVTHKGRLNFKDAEQFSSEAVRLARQHDCHNFLIDHSQTALGEHTYRLHTGGEELEQFGFSHSDRIAVVIQQNKDELNKAELEEYYSHGSVLKYFDKTEDAIKWLISRN